ncbi:sigma-70 family RNA polymerase sigma factor [Clostridium botulinum]|uniref:Sigma-70 family RNA polymerase sigma factor n=2 Tax=Clostridiaceae TaxID=31979 RepID=A0A0C2N2X3_CLOBO|nr:MULTISPECIES: sigma-70 family RNA polymerase sigma factor [Clostridium]ACD51198.1 RNA polymerase sigma-70 factor [Clostridium botulinum E3 str. Alaska E43]AJF29953.1 ECF subfamily RNA polymerase sigma-24 subunit [Clostridium botulinum]AJF33016.1 ECF subfamily RNA polymerase sigma-24 subunit [Clostridium botulinum]KAI3345224.1 sigma-70 family RNA polymerase sigma factor [Clostridium botulinum]KIL07435.1 ECF subfamily RNA polymerase sigma-24 subunit [Clostridium botulinum]
MGNSLYIDENISQDLDKYGDMILRLGYSYMKNIHDAEDILQEVLLKLIQGTNEFENEEHKKAWIICVSRNICKNKLKSSWFKKREEFQELPYYDNYLNHDVFEAVMKLPTKYREVIHLFYYEDYSTIQISNLINKKESTVRSLLHRARNILKDKLKEDYDFEQEL